MHDVSSRPLSRRTRFLVGLACVAAVGASVVGAVAASARSDVPNAPAVRVAPGSGSAAAPPLRAIIYETAPARARLSAGRPAPTARGSDAGNVRYQLAALEWARADAAIVPWDSSGTLRDRRFAAVLSGIAATGAHVRAVAEIEHRSGSRRAQLRALVKTRAGALGYLRVLGRPAVVVALAELRSRGCAQARAWRAAARGLWLVQATFPGYSRCRATADAWYPAAQAVRTAQAPGTLLIRHGYWPQSARAARLMRSVSAWQRSIARMTASHAHLQIIDSLNDWSRGTAI